MKVKGAGFFELHIEKIVLAVVAAVFVLVLVIQLGAEGPTVTVNNRKLPLDQAYEPAEDLARQARTRMNAQEPALPEVEEQIDLLGRFRQARAADLAPRDRIVLGPSINLGEVGEASPLGNTRFVDMVIPPPAEPVGYSFAATLDPWVVSETEGLAALVGASQPYDKAAVSVQAVYDSAELERALGAEPGGDLKAWPASWWRGMEILAVRLERQRQNPDGSWASEIETVPPPPGALDLPAELAETPDLAPRHIKQTVDEVQRGLARQVRRPAYYPIIAGDPWVEPREGMRLAGLEAGANPQAAIRQRELASIDSRLEQLREERTRLGGGGRDPRQPVDPRQQQDRARDTQLRRVEAQIERLERQREIVVAALAEMGFAPDKPGDAQDPRQQRQAEQRPGAGFGRQPEGEALFPAKRIEVWAHDLTAEPGAVYRYRVRLEMNNPAFGQAQFLIEEQRNEAEAPTRLSEPSQWTAPVLVAPMTAYFVTGANEAQQSAMGMRLATANVEVFTFLYGYYRKGQKTLEPGDPVAAWAELPEGLPIFDVAQPPPAEGARMPEPMPDDPRRRRAPQAPGGPDVLPIRTQAAADAYLLDVYESAAREGANGAAAGRAPRIVTFGNSAGEVVQRLVGQDRRSPLYARLNASAEAGRTQGQPEPEPEQPETGRDPPPPPPPPPGDAGGGGGGGGGG